MKPYESKLKPLEEQVAYQQVNTHFREVLNSNLYDLDAVAGDIASLIREAFEGSDWVTEIPEEDFVSALINRLEDNLEVEYNRYD